MASDKYQFILKGVSPAIMNTYDVDKTDMLTEFRLSPDQKKHNKPGDDRTPPWSWMTCLYTDGEKIAMPFDNIMSCLRKAGTAVPIKGNITFKQATQSGLLIESDFCKFEGAKGEIPLKSIEALRNLPFSVQAQKVKELGFRLFVKPCKPPGSKSRHIRVRPTFDQWRITGEISVHDDLLTPSVMKQIFDIAGHKVGLMDWRPSAKDSPGPYGRFEAKLTPLKG